MTNREYIRIVAQIAVLTDIIADGYGGHTVENVVQQLESRKNEAGKKGYGKEV